MSRKLSVSAESKCAAFPELSVTSEDHLDYYSFNSFLKSTLPFSFACLPLTQLLICIPVYRKKDLANSILFTNDAVVYHFPSFVVGNNMVIWLRLAAREAGMCSL